jgi:chromate transporter
VSLIGLYVLLLQAVAASFSGLGSVPVIRAALVDGSGLIADARLAEAVSLGYVTPGPLGIYVVTVGYWVAGVPGAVIAWAALATPALLVVPLSALFRRGRDLAWVRGAAAGVTLAATALLLHTAVEWAARVTDLRRGALLAACAVALATGRVAPGWVVLGAALVGAALLA